MSIDPAGSLNGPSQTRARTRRRSCVQDCNSETQSSSAAMGFPLPLPSFMDVGWIIHEGVPTPASIKKKNSWKNPTFSVNQKQQLRRAKAGCEQDADAAAQTGPRSRCRLTGALAASTLLHRRRGGGASAALLQV